VEIQEHQSNGVMVLNIVGRIDSTTGPTLSESIDAMIDKGHTCLVLDLSEVPYISSAGLRVLSVAVKAIRAADARGSLYLTNLSSRVAHAFNISGFNQLFSIFDTVAEAKAVVDACRDTGSDE
jgi:anti-sigma B factor antagonist